MNFKQAVFRILVELFTKDYVAATGGEPQSMIGTLILIANRLRSLVFKMPEVDRWFEEDMPIIKNIKGANFEYLEIINLLSARSS